MKKKMWIFLGILIVVIIAIVGYLVFGRRDASKDSQPLAQTYYIYDTVVNIKLYGDKASQQNLDDIGNMLERMDRELSRTKTNGELYQVNEEAGVKPVHVSAETMDVIKQSLKYAKEMDGLFDPTIGPLVDLWGIGTDKAHVPKQSEIDQARSLTNYKSVVIDDAAGTVMLPKKDMVLDLGGIGKGYAADRVAEYIKSKGIESALIDLGGSSIIALGNKPDGSKWNIGLQDPDQSRGTQLGTIKISDEVIDDSGVYERFFMQNGIRYHHILDPRTGYPAQNGLKSVTIMSPNATDADALSTGVFLMGAQDGLKYIESLPEKIEAYFITDDNKIYATPGIKQRLVITDSTYSIAD